MTTSDHRRAYRGPAILLHGFRPFFLLGAAWAAIAMVLWVGWYLWGIEIETAFPPVAWHVHELLFGYLSAVIAGFLLTAIPNWTGRLPVTGRPLAGLVLLWLLGRVAVAGSGAIGITAAGLIAAAFPAGLIAVALREILASGNRRNVPVIALLSIYLAGEIVFVLEAASDGYPVFGTRIAIAAVVTLIALIGGRVTPSFTGNWIRANNPGGTPAPFGRFDKSVLIFTVPALICWVAAPSVSIDRFSLPIGVLLIAVGLLHLLRQGRWQPWRTAAEPLVTVLHVGYLFLPAGFILAGLAVIAPDLLGETAALHAWTAGAFGTMTLAIMTRATRGHTGRPLTAPPSTVLLYLSVVVAAISRTGADLFPGAYDALITLAGLAWAFGFAGFAMLYGALLVRR